MNTNILITSAGKRVTLTKQFQETLRRFYPEAKVFTTDMNPAMAPAGLFQTDVWLYRGNRFRLYRNVADNM